MKPPLELFPAGADLPLFSGTAQRADLGPAPDFTPQPKQTRLDLDERLKVYEVIGRCSRPGTVERYEPFTRLVKADDYTGAALRARALVLAEGYAQALIETVEFCHYAYSPQTPDQETDADPIGPNPEPEPTEEKWTFSFGSTPIGSFTVKP